MPRPGRSRTRMRNRQRPDALRVRGVRRPARRIRRRAEVSDHLAPRARDRGLSRKPRPDDGALRRGHARRHGLAWLARRSRRRIFQVRGNCRLAGPSAGEDTRGQRVLCCARWSRQQTCFGLPGIRNALPTSFAMSRRGWRIQSTAGGPDRSRGTPATTRLTPRRAGRWRLQASTPCSTRPGMGRWSRRCSGRRNCSTTPASASLP